VFEICFPNGEHENELHLGQQGKPQQRGKEMVMASEWYPPSETVVEEKGATPPPVTTGGL